MYHRIVPNKSRNIYLFIYSFSYIWHFSLKLFTNIFIYVFLLHVSTKRYTFLLVGVFRYHQNKNEAPQISTPDLTKTCEYIESLAKICNEPRLTKLPLQYSWIHIYAISKPATHQRLLVSSPRNRSTHHIKTYVHIKQSK